MEKNDSIIIKALNISKDFGQTNALVGLSADFMPGKLHGLIGPDGAGKTTLLRILTGLLRPTSGKVEYFYKEKKVGLESIRSKIGYMPSKASLYPDLSIEEHLIFFKKLYSLSDEEYKQKTADLFKITRLEEFRNRKIGQLSGGMYKKTGLMCSLLQSPSVLFLDEPTNGVDPISRREFWELLYTLIKQNILVIVSTAYMDEAERCGEVHFMDNGSIIESGEPNEILKRRKIGSFNDIFQKAVKVE